MILRDYQRHASDAIFREWETANSTLVVFPTGLGKTILFADVIRRAFPRRSLVIAHREELIFQACDKIHRSTGLTAGVEMGDARITAGVRLPPVIVATVQTLTAGGDGSGRMGKFDPMQFGALIVDEAHHACASGYRKVLDYFRQNPALRVLGVTATPDRADEEALGQVFDTVADDYEILDAVRDGWLVPIEQQFVSVADLDFSQIRTTAGDLNGADLARVMEDERNLHSIAGPAIEIIGKRRALVFTASVAHAERLSEIFNRHRQGMADFVSGKTPKDRRRELLSDFSSGRTQVMCNCNVLTEGFDCPEVEVVIQARPTKSRSLYAQQIGRATRPLPGVVDGPETPEERTAAIASSAKPSCLVVDFVGNSGRHKLCTSADILGGKVSEEIIEAAVRAAREGGKPVRMDDAIAEQQRKAEEAKRAEAARRARLVVGAKWSAKAVNPFDVFQIEEQAARGWDHGKSLSEKQRGMLAKQGIDPDSVSYSQARQLIQEMFRRWDGNLCSFKQAKILAKRGLPTNCSRDEAKALIDQIAVREGWGKAA